MDLALSGSAGRIFQQQSETILRVENERRELSDLAGRLKDVSLSQRDQLCKKDTEIAQLKAKIDLLRSWIRCKGWSEPPGL